MYEPPFMKVLSGGVHDAFSTQLLYSIHPTLSLSPIIAVLLIYWDVVCLAQKSLAPLNH